MLCLTIHNPLADDLLVFISVGHRDKITHQRPRDLIEVWSRPLTLERFNRPRRGQDRDHIGGVLDLIVDAEAPLHGERHQTSRRSAWCRQQSFFWRDARGVSTGADSAASGASTGAGASTDAASAPSGALAVSSPRFGRSIVLRRASSADASEAPKVVAVP